MPLPGRVSQEEEQGGTPCSVLAHGRRRDLLLPTYRTRKIRWEDRHGWAYAMMTEEGLCCRRRGLPAGVYQWLTPAYPLPVDASGIYSSPHQVET